MGQLRRVSPHEHLAEAERLAKSAQRLHTSGGDAATVLEAAVLAQTHALVAQAAAAVYCAEAE